MSEALALTVSDIDADAMLVHVRHGKGAKDRTVPLPHHTLSLLRRYWLAHKHPPMIFPAVGRGQKNGHTAGAFDRETHRWHHSSKAFFVPVRILSKLVKHRFFSLIRNTGLLGELPQDSFDRDWNVDSRPVGTGRRALKYLSAYVFRTAISDKRIVSISDDAVTFRYTDSSSGESKLLSLKPFEFIRRFLQHVLPSGFMKIRSYGFLHPSSSIPLALAAMLLEAFADVRAVVEHKYHSAGPFCPRCHAPGHFLRFSPRPGPVLKSGFT